MNARFSMGTGEVTRYIGKYGADRVRKAVLIGTHTLIIHGDADRILPPDATSRRQAKMIKHVKFAELAGGPHGLCWTHADRVNAELVPFVE